LFGVEEWRMPRDRRRCATALVLGGRSEIGLAITRRLAEHGLERVVLAGRDRDAIRLAVEAAPIAVDVVDVVAWDALDVTSHEPLVARATELLGTIDVVVCAVGLLGHHAGLSMRAVDADLLMRSNFSGPAAALSAVAQQLERQGNGTIIVLSSIAGARPRRSNFVYGSAKGALDAYAQGLGDALIDTDVRVHVLRPGFVVSQMTAGLDPAPMATTPGVVADAVVDVLDSTTNRTVWIPARLGWMMAVLRNVPAPLWRRIAGDR
jgi:decaprenylphospho-beta-D-erythro-pentofuranosid-2-ulose 2-reductase